MSDFLESYELYHHGVKGQKWGERRYQYQDGSYTPEGKRHYGIGTRASGTKPNRKTIVNDYNKTYQKEFQKLAKDRKKMTSAQLQAATKKATSKVTNDMIKKYGRQDFYKAKNDEQASTAGKIACGMILGSVGAAAMSTLASTALLAGSSWLVTKY